MSHGLTLTTVPKDLYYVERKLVADQAAEIERLWVALSDAVEIAESGYDEMTLIDRSGFRRLKEMVRGHQQQPDGTK